MVAPFLKPATVTKIRALALRGWATNALLEGTRTIVLAHWHEASETWVARDPQEVILSLAGRGLGSKAFGAEAAGIDGWLSKPVPFAVETGDEFSVEGGGIPGGRLGGRVNAVPPPVNGIQLAGFTITIGEVAP